MNLKDIKSSLEEIVTTMANLTNMEYAIFNTKSELVSSTEVYLHKKGKNVHSQFIQEVLNLGKVVVSNPGLMESCIGCGFENNCPSTIEILFCIELNGIPIGVLSLTSFSKEGHDLIEDNINNYMNILEYISHLISIFAESKISSSNNQILHKAIDEIVKDNASNYIITDKKGLIVYWSKEFQSLFSCCDFYTQSIDIIFPANIINWIFSIDKPSRKYFTTKDFKGFINITPLSIKNNIEGYSIKLEKVEDTLENTEQQDFLNCIITYSDEIYNIKKRIKKIADSPSSVLITGETGTGKELVAQAIHYTGNRSNNPFIPINCANIPDYLFESELFGYEEGAFTGAKKGGKMGILEMSNGGTVLLDEIGDLPLHLQAKLLRVLQEHTIKRLGSNTIIPIDIRIIAATNQDLESMMDKGKFRGDLFYRLNIISITLPSLKDINTDIELLIMHFISKYNNILTKNIQGISKDALNILKSYSWPGNIRELENAIEYAINMEETNIIEITNLPNRIIKSSLKEKIGFKEYVVKQETDLIINTLNKYGWDLNGKEKAADNLGISLRTLYRRLECLENKKKVYGQSKN